MKRGLGVIAALLLGSAAARAESRPSLLAEQAQDAPSAVLELDLGLFATEDFEGEGEQSLSIVLGAGYRLRETIELELDWPLVFYNSDEFSQFDTGNPFVAVYYRSASDHGYARIGFGVGLPLVQVDTPDELDLGNIIPFLRQIVPNGAASLARGYWDAWLFAAERLSLAIPAQFEQQHGLLVIGTEGAAALLISTDRVLDDDLHASFQGALMLGARVAALTAGARLQGVWYVAPGDGAVGQFALVPFAQLELGRAFLDLRFVFNLDEPLGPFEKSFVWGLFLGGGARF